MAGGGEGVSLEFTPTWVVALVCTVIVAISLGAERILHYIGKFLLRKKQGPLYEALLKIKEELMLLGFISLLLTVFQNRISTFCISKHLADDWLPCKREPDESNVNYTAHFQTNTFFSSILPGTRRLLVAAASNSQGHCERQGKAPLLSLDALHDLHIFIFVLAVTHVFLSAFTILLGSLQIRRWKLWEDAIQKKEHDPEDGNQVICVNEHEFIKRRFKGVLLSWLNSFVKQFFGCVNKSEYTTLRLGFITTHYRDNPKFNFYKYMVRAFETDFRKVVGISWYLWGFVVVFLFLNVSGWHAYFWIAFVPLILLIAVGTKLEHIIFQLADDVAQKHVAVKGDLVVRPSDDHFWFHRPRLVLCLIHIILFQNAFEIAVFFWMWVMFKFDSCIMGKVGYIIPRLVIGVLVQLLCSYSILPLYAIVAQMGSSFNKAIFEEHMQVKLTGWAQKAKMNVEQRKTADPHKKSPSGDNSAKPTTLEIETTQQS